MLTVDKPHVLLRIINLEMHREEMAQELATSVRALGIEGVQVLVGAYRAG